MTIDKIVKTCMVCKDFYDTRLETWLSRKEYRRLYPNELNALSHGICEEQNCKDQFYVMSGVDPRTMMIIKTED